MAKKSNKIDKKYYLRIEKKYLMFNIRSLVKQVTLRNPSSQEQQMPIRWHLDWVKCEIRSKVDFIFKAINND